MLGFLLAHTVVMIVSLLQMIPDLHLVVWWQYITSMFNLGEPEQAPH